MKKLLLSLGSIGAIITPLATVISCGKVKEKKVDTYVQGATPFKHVSENKTEFNVKEDGLYIIGDSYSGKLWNGGTISQGHEVKGRVKIGEAHGWSLDPSVQLGDNDSIYMLYDKDKNDGLTIDNFEKTFYFSDTSIASKAVDLNAKIFGNLSVKGMFGSQNYISFIRNKNKTGGIINNYIGGQNNHVTDGGSGSSKEDFKNRIVNMVKLFKGQYAPLVNKMLRYYGLKTVPNKNGFYDNDPNLNGASKAFAPVFQVKPPFTYDRVASNAIKITYHSSKTWQATAANFSIKPIGGSFKKYGSLSLGEQDWASYTRHSNAKYVGIHKLK